MKPRGGSYESPNWTVLNLVPHICFPTPSEPPGLKPNGAVLISVPAYSTFPFPILLSNSFRAPRLETQRRRINFSSRLFNIPVPHCFSTPSEPRGLKPNGGVPPQRRRRAQRERGCRSRTAPLRRHPHQLHGQAQILARAETNLYQ
jgi:hypothetical protein